MNSVSSLLTELQRLDIRVWVEGELVRCSAPAGALTAELREALRLRKRDILAFFAMAEAAAAQPSAVVPLEHSGSGTPVFGVPGHTGDVFQFRALAQALRHERPFFALQPPGLDGHSAPLARIEDLAAHFAAQVRAIRPRGPWIIAGICMGGATAYELARLLLDGKSPGFLALFGAPHPAFFRPLSLLRHHLANRARGWQVRARILAAQSGRERLEYLLWRMRSHRQPLDPVLAARARLEAATLAAVRAYDPAPFPGHLHHFIPSKAWELASRTQTERWHTLAGRVETCYGPDGCTVDDMLLPRYAPVFGAHLRRACARAGL